MAAFLSSLGPEGMIVGMLLVLGMLLNVKMQAISDQIRRNEVDDLDLRLQLVKRQVLTIDDVRSYVEHRRDHVNADSGAIWNRVLEAMT